MLIRISERFQCISIWKYQVQPVDAGERLSRMRLGNEPSDLCKFDFCSIKVCARSAQVDAVCARFPYVPRAIIYRSELEFLMVISEDSLLANFRHL